MTTTRSQARREAGERANVLAVWLDSKADGSDLTHRELAARQSAAETPGTIASTCAFGWGA